MGMLLENQPVICRQPLPFKELDHEVLPYVKRVMFFDPKECFENIAATIPWIDNFKRYNTFGINIIFPENENNICGCGCGAALTGRRTRWATDECRKFALAIYWILYGNVPRFSNIIYHYRGWACNGCGDMNAEFHIDHIIPVWAGGGFCWLSNYQVLCTDCHKKKTKADRLLYV